VRIRFKKAAYKVRGLLGKPGRGRLESALMALDGVEEVRVYPGRGIVTLLFDPDRCDAEAIRKAFKRAGYPNFSRT